MINIKPTDKLRWFKNAPDHPGFYWVAEAGEVPHIVEIRFESDSNGLWYVLLPGDDHKYPVGSYAGALWRGPLSAPE